MDEKFTSRSPSCCHRIKLDGANGNMLSSNLQKKPHYGDKFCSKDAPTVDSHYYSHREKWVSEGRNLPLGSNKEHFKDAAISSQAAGYRNP